MEKIIVAVGSTRRPKLNAVREALDQIAPQWPGGAQFEVAGIDVPSGVRHTPLSGADIMAGARQRAETLSRMARKNYEPWNYFAGLEGGLDVLQEDGLRRVFLENWAYITDGSTGAFGRSGGILVPEPLAVRVVDEGVELAEAIDAFAGGHGIRDAEGAWGIFTRNLITRQEAFRVAVVNAFAPFYNREIYSSRPAKARA